MKNETNKTCSCDFEEGEYCRSCNESLFISEARAAGIPLSVIKGKTRLSDHFSKAYINYKSNHKEKLK